ncbi:hypothetical protein [Microvirga flocculans]|uniref:hypothetical protein n=1 Tax=Microvirga flocculans TaxID=217168 RepID=UPI0012B5CDCF|nr:hypothetical protein [Microvirga flocculans]
MSPQGSATFGVATVDDVRGHRKTRDAATKAASFAFARPSALISPFSFPLPLDLQESADDSRS